MMEYAKFTGQVAEAQDFNFFIWTDKMADGFIQEVEEKGFKGLMRTWRYIKRDQRKTRYAKMADFLRLVILYSVGGVYFDADVIACDSLEFMVDTPGVVSFPFHPQSTHEVSQGLISAPPHHRLLEIALEMIMVKGERLTVLHPLDATGPKMFGKATDAYFKERGIDIAPLNKQTYHENDSIEGVLVKDTTQFWDLKVADVQFGDMQTASLGLYHMSFRSWSPDSKMFKCFNKPETIEPFFKYFCAHPEKRDYLIDNFANECGSTGLEDKK